MGRRICLAVGVSDAPPLDYLAGAANGARAFGAWAKANDYETTILVDDLTPVNIAEIKLALEHLLDGGDVIDRLIIYFAGHGVARDADEDLWLPSQWRSGQRAIAIGALKRRLERFGVRQLAIISDACRNATSDDILSDLTPDKVLGLGPYDQQLPQVDIIKASSKYASAYMLPGETLGEAVCIFTGVLEEALWGLQADAFSKFNANKCITSSSLADYLEQAVPNKATVYGVKLQPDITTGFRVGKDIYLDKVLQNAPSLRNWPVSNQTHTMGQGGNTVSEKRGWSTVIKSPQTTSGYTIRTTTNRTFQANNKDTFQTNNDRSFEFSRKTISEENLNYEFDFKLPAQEFNRESYEARKQQKVESRSEIIKEYENERFPKDVAIHAHQMGILNNGLLPHKLIIPPSTVGATKNEKYVELYRDLGGHSLKSFSPFLMQYENGIWVGSTALGNFVTSLTVDSMGCKSVIFRSGFIDGYAKDAEFAVASLRAGTLSVDKAVELAVSLRQGKLLDPMLGIIAAYLYESRGDIESIRQIAFFHAQAMQPISFDLVLLGRIPIERSGGHIIAKIPEVADRQPRTALERRMSWTTRATPAASTAVAGSFPLLRQGWALIDGNMQGAFPAELEEIGDHLLNAPFTSLTQEGGKKLAKLLLQE